MREERTKKGLKIIFASVLFYTFYHLALCVVDAAPFIETLCRYIFYAASLCGTYFIVFPLSKTK